jgi:hypothetical protein
VFHALAAEFYEFISISSKRTASGAKNKGLLLVQSAVWSVVTDG